MRTEFVRRNRRLLNRDKFYAMFKRFGLCAVVGEKKALELWSWNSNELAFLPTPRLEQMRSPL